MAGHFHSKQTLRTLASVIAFEERLQQNANTLAEALNTQEKEEEEGGKKKKKKKSRTQLFPAGSFAMERCTSGWPGSFNDRANTLFLP